MGRATTFDSPKGLPADRVRITDLQERKRSTVAGRVRAIRVQPWGGKAALECTVADETGSIVIVFLGRRDVPGIQRIGDHADRHLR